MSKLVVFLGNPGSQYKLTRHNAAWIFADSLDLPLSWQSKFHSLFIKDSDTVYLKPQTFMNESGLAVSEAASFFSVKPKDILVVHDDIEKQIGDILLENGGGLRGHNGLRSINQHLGTSDFPRLRIGVGRPDKQDVASFVLGKFPDLDLAILNDKFKTTALSKMKEFINRS